MTEPPEIPTTETPGGAPANVAPVPPVPAPPPAYSAPPGAAPPASAAAGTSTGPAALPDDRPELAVGAAFAGGFVLAMLLKRLAR